MLYVFWGLLNLSIFLIFITLCFEATKAISAKKGNGIAFVFVLGLLSLAGGPNVEDNNLEPNTNKIKTWEFISEDSLKKITSSQLIIVLENNIISKIELGIKYGKEGLSNIPISAYSITNGFLSGTKWKPEAIHLMKTEDNNKFEYEVAGILDWKILGTTIYSQWKEYKGVSVVN